MRVKPYLHHLAEGRYLGRRATFFFFLFVLPSHSSKVRIFPALERILGGCGSPWNK